MWLDLPKGVLYAHSFKSYFSPLFDRYNNRLKVSKVYFYWGLIHGPVWHPRVLGWSVNDSNLPSQADSQQRIATRLSGETRHRCSYILWYVELKTAWIDAIWPYKIFWIWRSRNFMAPHHHPLWYRLPCEINYLKWWSFQLAIHSRVHPLNGPGWL